MSEDSRYNVTFSGHLVPGMQVAEVKQNLVRLFKSTEKAIDKLFSGNIATVKKDLNHKVANTYLRAMKKAGAIAELEKIAETSDAPSFKPQTDVVVTDKFEDDSEFAELSAPPPLAVDTSPMDDGTSHFDADDDFVAPPPTSITNEADAQGYAPAGQWQMDPVGSLLTKPKREVHREIPKSDQFELSPPKSDVGQLHHDVVAVTPDISQYAIAETGSRLSEEKIKQKIKTPDIGDIEIAEVGVDMGQAKSEVEKVAPDTSQLSLAEEGGTIEQLTHMEEIVNPDTSHLHLADD